MQAKLVVELLKEALTLWTSILANEVVLQLLRCSPVQMAASTLYGAARGKPAANPHSALWTR